MQQVQVTWLPELVSVRGFLAFKAFRAVLLNYQQPSLY